MHFGNIAVFNKNSSNANKISSCLAAKFPEDGLFDQKVHILCVNEDGTDATGAYCDI